MHLWLYGKAGRPVYARMTSVVWGEDRPSPDTIARGILPMLQSIPGYAGFIMLSDSEGESVVGFTLWESESALEAAEPLLTGIRTAETASRSAESTTTKIFHVIALDVK